jgi:hypothetical protein
MGFADRIAPEYVHEDALLLIGIVLASACVLGAILLIRHAPAATVGLAGAVIVGTIAFFVSSTHGARGVPQDVGSWSSLGLWVGGATGLLATRGRPPSSVLWHAAVTSFVLAPFGTALLVLAIQRAVPLYVMRGAGYCHYDVDVMGDWSSYVAFLFFVDVLVVVALLLVAARQAKRAESMRLGDDAWAKL